MAPVEDSEPLTGWQSDLSDIKLSNWWWITALHSLSYSLEWNKWSFLSLIECGRPARTQKRQSLIICFIKMHFYVIAKIKKKKSVLLIGEIRKIKFIMQTALANEVYFGIHTAYVVQER